MNKFVLTLFLFSVLIFNSFSQNLVSNGSFETYIALPSSYGQFDLVDDWNSCGGTSGPDYFHAAGAVLTYFGTIGPNTGSAMAGICSYHSTLANFREYVSTQLTSPLTAGQLY